MKNSAFFLALATTVTFFLFENGAFAQMKNTWKGGTPGRPTDWNCASNWLENRVPNEFSDVFVSDVSTSTFAAPVISSGDFEVNALFVAKDAKLSIEATASLTVLETVKGVDPSDFEGKLILPADDSRKVDAEPVAVVHK